MHRTIQCIFLREEKELLARAAIVAARRAVGPDYAVTWDVDVVIFIQNIADSAEGARTSGTHCNFLVRQNFPARNFCHNSANAIAKRACLNIFLPYPFFGHVFLQQFFWVPQPPPLI